MREKDKKMTNPDISDIQNGKIKWNKELVNAYDLMKEYSINKATVVTASKKNGTTIEWEIYIRAFFMKKYNIKKGEKLILNIFKYKGEYYPNKKIFLETLGLNPKTVKEELSRRNITLEEYLRSTKRQGFYYQENYYKNFKESIEKLDDIRNLKSYENYMARNNISKTKMLDLILDNQHNKQSFKYKNREYKSVKDFAIKHKIDYDKLVSSLNRYKKATGVQISLKDYLLNRLREQDKRRKVK